MWLESEKVKEGSEEIRGGERETPLEMRDENHPLTRLRGGGNLVAGSTADNLGADPARLAQPLDVQAADF